MIHDHLNSFFLLKDLILLFDVQYSKYVNMVIPQTITENANHTNAYFIDIILSSLYAIRLKVYFEFVHSHKILKEFNFEISNLIFFITYTMSILTEFSLFVLDLSEAIRTI